MEILFLAYRVCKSITARATGEISAVSAHCFLTKEHLLLHLSQRRSWGKCCGVDFRGDLIAFGHNFMHFYASIAVMD